jgi:hypothetical protein
MLRVLNWVCSIEKGKEGNEISNKQITHFKGEFREKLLRNAGSASNRGSGVRNWEGKT